MSEFEHQTSIDESIIMVRGGRRLPRKECHFVPEEEYRKLMELKRDPVTVSKEEPTKRTVALHIAHALAPLLIGATWILGAMEGLADPVFTGVVTSICVLWAVVNYKWGAVND